MEYDGGVDVIEDKGPPYEHFQACDEGDQAELDPVPIRRRMGGEGEHHDMDRGASDQQKSEYGQNHIPAVLPQLQIEEMDE